MPITFNQHRAGFSQALVAIFSDATVPKMGLSGFFTKKTLPTLGAVIEVERNNVKIAIDVQRATDPVRNTFNNSTEKIFIPPFFSEMFDITSLQRYDVTFGAGNNPSNIDARLMLDQASTKVQALKNKIMRAIAKQQADVLQTGIVTLKNGQSINFGRKAGSMVVLSGGAVWSAPTTATPLTDFDNGAVFLRQTGRSASGAINVVMGGGAFTNFMANADVQKKASIFRQIERISIGMPQFDDSTGLVFQGQIGSSDYKYNLWTYNEFYEDASNTVVKYLADNMVVMVPGDFNAVETYCAIPMVMGDANTGQYVAPIQGDIIFHDLIDPRKRTWDAIVESAPIVIPVAVDKIYSFQAY